MNMESNEKIERIKNALPSIIIVSLVVFIIGLFVYSYVSDAPIFVITKLYNYTVTTIVSMTGLSQWLVKGIVIIVLIPLLWVIPNTVRGNYKKQAKAAGMLYFGVFFLSIYFMSKDIYFSHSGNETLKWYALTPEGVKFSDTPGRDPVYGITLKPVTPEVIRKLKLLQKGDIKPIDPSNFIFFNPITGEAQAWYYKYPDGTVEFFDKPGYHPISGESLEPITKQVLFEWRDSQAKKAPRKPEAGVGGTPRPSATGTPSGGVSASKGSSTAPQERKPTAEGVKNISEREAVKEESRLALFKSGVSDNFVTYRGMINVAILVESLGETKGKDVLYGHLKSNKINFITTFFQEDLILKNGFFYEIYNGKTDLLKKSDVMSKIDYLVIGKLNLSFKRGTELDNKLIVCNSSMSYKVVNKFSELFSRDNISTVGPGYSEEAALNRSMEILTEKLIGNIMKY